MEQFKRSPLPLTESDKAFAQFLLKAVRTKQAQHTSRNPTRDRLRPMPGINTPVQVKSGG